MNVMKRKLLASVWRPILAINVLLAVLAVHPHIADSASDGQDPLLVLEHYLRASYARDYKEAYQYISAEDRRLKDERSYVRERGAFTGFTLDLARKLAGYIEVTPVEKRLAADRGSIKLKVNLPDANRVAPVLLNWDTDRLEALSANERDNLIESLEKLRKDRKLAMVAGEESFEVINEGGAWKVFLNWASGVKLIFQTTLPPAAPMEAEVLQSELTARQGEIFNIAVRIRNTSQQEITARIGHLVDPHDVRDYLELVECGFLLPVRLLPGTEEEFITTYLLRGGLPERVRELAVTYAVTLQK
jgi:hypothetical protein